MISRRVALKQIAVISVGAALVPSCINRKSEQSALFKNIIVTQEQENLIASLAEAIIPKTDSPGAKETSTHTFIAKMVDDCMPKNEQEKWLAGLTAFDELIEKRNGKTFSEYNAQEQLALLADFETKKIEGDDVNFFYSIIKRLTLRGYTSSEYYLTNVMKYNIIPGPFKGCVPVNA